MIIVIMADGNNVYRSFPGAVTAAFVAGVSKQVLALALNQK